MLVLDSQRHELACSSCGAPLHDLKAMPMPSGKAAKPSVVHSSQPVGKKKKKSQYQGVDYASALGKQGKRKSGKRKKTNGYKALKKLWDVIEDVID